MEKEDCLSEEDLERLAQKLESRFFNRFYSNVGRGLMSLAWKGVVMGLIALAVYGAAKGKGWTL